MICTLKLSLIDVLRESELALSDFSVRLTCFDCQKSGLCRISLFEHTEDENIFDYGLDNVILMAFCPGCNWKKIVSIEVECPDNMEIAQKRAGKNLRQEHDAIGRCGEGEDLEIFEVK